MLWLGEILHRLPRGTKQTFWHSESFSITSIPLRPESRLPGQNRSLLSAARNAEITVIHHHHAVGIHTASSKLAVACTLFGSPNNATADPGSKSRYP